MRIAVIIVNWNGGAYLARTLAAATGQDRRPDRVIVVDNASTDGSRALVSAFPGVELIELPDNRGFAGANNVAAKAASDCDWLAFLNPDAFPEPAWLHRLSDATHAHFDCAMFASELRAADQPGRLDGVGDAYHVSGLSWRVAHGGPLDAAPTVAHEVFSPCGAAALIRRNAFEDVGGFDESFFCYAEDVDLAFRLRLRGHSCFYVPGAIVHHVGSGLTGRHSAFSIYHGHRNLVWAWVKNMPGWSLARYLPQHLLLTLVTVVRFGATGQLSTILRAKRDALFGLGPVLRARREVQARRLARPRAVLAAMTHGWLTPYRAHVRRRRRDAMLR